MKNEDTLKARAENGNKIFNQMLQALMSEGLEFTQDDYLALPNLTKAIHDRHGYPSTSPLSTCYNFAELTTVLNGILRTSTKKDDLEHNKALFIILILRLNQLKFDLRD